MKRWLLGRSAYSWPDGVTGWDTTLRAELKERMRECTENAHKKKPPEESNRALEIEKLLEQCP
jgi:hypothetical protein